MEPKRPTITSNACPLPTPITTFGEVERGCPFRNLLTPEEHILILPSLPGPNLGVDIMGVIYFTMDGRSEYLVVDRTTRCQPEYIRLHIDVLN